MNRYYIIISTTKQCSKHTSVQSSITLRVLDTVLWTKVLANKCLRKYLEASKSSKELLESLQ